MKHDESLGEDCECIVCRAQTLQISPSAMPTRRNNIAPRPPQHNSYERGILKDSRGVPILKDGGVIPLKEYTKDRHRIDEQIRRVKAGDKD